jgi:hypothetical protein
MGIVCISQIGIKCLEIQKLKFSRYDLEGSKRLNIVSVMKLGSLRDINDVNG